LGFEGLLLSAAVLPLTDEGLLVAADMVVVQMLKNKGTYWYFWSSRSQTYTPLASIILDALP
jgi:hypothetical protein